MRVSAIQGSNGVYTKRNNKMQSQIRKTMEAPASDIQPQAVSFKANSKMIAIVGTIGAVIGGALLGPVGIVIGAAAGAKGAEFAEQDDELKEEQKKAKNNKK